MKGNIRIPF